MRHVLHTLFDVAVRMVYRVARALERRSGTPVLVTPGPRRPWEVRVDSCPTLDRLPRVESGETAAYRSQTSSR